MSVPMFRGGQGRSSRSVRDDGTSLAFTLLVVVGILGSCALAAWGSV